MARLIALLRGVNLGPNKRVKMAELREVLTNAGYEDVRTLVNSGNVVLTSRQEARLGGEGGPRADPVRARASTPR